MKKRTAFGLALLLTIPSMSPVVLADSVEDEEEIEEVVEDKENETYEDAELEFIENLSLEDAIDRALNSSTSLMLLNYQLEILETQEGRASKDYRDTSFDIRDLERTRDRLRELEEHTFQERLMIQNQLELLEDAIEQLEDAIEQLKSSKITLSYNEEEAKESIKMSTTATFTQLLMSQQQLELQQKALETKESEVAAIKRQYELGLLSRDRYNLETREIERQKTSIEQAEKSLHNDMAKFALDLGLVYHDDFSLEALELSELELVEQEKETTELIENSFQYKSQLEAIALAEYNRERVYEDKDSKSFDKNEADLNVKVEEENLAQLELELESSIRQLYFDVEEGYKAILDAERELIYAEEDYKKLQRQYQLGIVSRVDYELAGIQVDEAKLRHELAKHSYFLLTEQVKLLEHGVII